MTNFIEEQQKEAGKKFYPVMKFSNPKNEIEHKQFQIVKPIIQKAFDNWFLNAGRKGIDELTAQTITNTLNHILESGLLEEKEEHQDWCKLTGELEYSSCGCWKDHNTAVRNIKELLEKLSK